MRHVLLATMLLASPLAQATPPVPPAPLQGGTAQAPTPLNPRVIPMEAVRTKVEQGVLDWLRTAARPFAGASPSTAELGPLVDRLASARVIGLGEITHGTHEDLAFKSALIRALVERGAIDTLVFELNRLTGQRLDRYVARGSTETDAAAAMKDARVYQVWMTRELADLLDWLRTWNASAARPIRIVGVDVQDASRDLADALAALERLDAPRARDLRARLAPWVSEEGLNRHQSFTVATLDRAGWQASIAAARELEAALRGRDARGFDAAQAGRHGIDMMEYEVPGMAKVYWQVPEDVMSRRDVAMADRLVDALPADGRAALWAHDMHVARLDVPHGFGYTSMGSQLHHRLGRKDYATLTYSARRIDFHAKSVADPSKQDRTSPFGVWRYDAEPHDLGALFARAGQPRFWVDLGALPPDETGLVFRLLNYGRPSFGWNVGEPFFPTFPVPVGYGSDVIVHFDTLTPSHRLP